MKIILAEFKRKFNFFEETQYKNKWKMLKSKQIMHPIFSFFDTDKKTGAHDGVE